MSDVTGNLGSESIRLRGMALEETQYLIYQELELANKIAQKKATGKEPQETARDRRRAAAAEATDRAFGGVTKAAGGFGETLEKAGKKLELLAGNAIRLTRSFDSNVKNTDFAMRQIAAGSKGMAGTIAKFSADSVAQLEEQYDTYKKLTNVGGTTAAGFDKLRETTTEMGVTMQEYVGLTNSNLGSLRMGGTSIRKSLELLQGSVKSLRKNTSGVNEEFMNLGVNQYDYAQHILDTTASLGGFGKQTDTAGEGFQKQMLRTTKVSQGLAEAFGANREELLKKTAEAMKKPLNRAILSAFGIPPEVQKAKLEAYSAIGLDEKTAIEAIVAQAGGPVSDAVGLMTSISGNMLPMVDRLAEEMAKTPDDLAGALERTKKQMGPGVIEEMRNTIMSISKSGLSAMEPGMQAVVGIMQGFVDNTGDFTQMAENIKAMKAATARGESPTLDALGQLQKNNIDLAVTFAKTNTTLNKFGLTAAFATQLIVRALASGTAVGVKGMDSLFEQGTDGKGHEATRKFLNSLDKDVADWGKTLMGDLVPGDRPSADLPTHGKIVGDKQINVQGKRVLASQVDTARTEATAGAPTNEYQKQGAIHLDRVIPNARFTAFHDSGKNRDTPHGEFSIDVVPDSAKTKDEYEALKKTFDAEMRALGMDNKDYKLLNEFGVKGGSHLHLQFANQNAAKKYFEAYAKKYGTTTAEPVAPTAPVTPPPSQKTSAAPAQTTTSVASAPSSTATGTDTGVNNTSTQASQEIMFAGLIEKFTGMIISDNEITRQTIREASSNTGNIVADATNKLVNGA